MPPRPMRMFIYQPNYTVDGEGKNKEYLNTKTWNNVTYFPVRKGDVFTTAKRPKEFLDMQNQTTSKVVSVKYSLHDGSCNVVLAEKVTVRKEEPKEEPINEEQTTALVEV